MSSLPNTTAVALPAPVPALRPLTARQEAYARCVAAGMSYAEAFRQSGCVASTSGSMSQQIQRLNKHAGVRARAAELRGKVDDDIVASLRERMAWLRLIVTAKPEELSRVITEPCAHCWPPVELAAAFAAHFTPSEFSEERPPLPDHAKPRPGCPHCKGEGLQRAQLTPTDELSEAGRALFIGASQDKDGVIKIETHDQLAASEMLNKLQGAYVTKSLNLNANVNVPAAKDASPADALRLFDMFGGGS